MVRQRRQGKSCYHLKIRNEYENVSGKRPDIIAIQELTGWVWCPTNFGLLKDYQAANLLLTAIRDSTGQEYRIAYLIVKETNGGEGGCGTDGGS